MDDAQRVAQTRDMMEERDIDLLAIPASDDLRYLTGFSPLADERPCYPATYSSQTARDSS